MADSSYWARIGQFSATITILPSSMAAGWVLGYFIVDRPFNSFPWGSIALTLLGAAAGFYQIFKLLLARRENGGKPDESE